MLMSNLSPHTYTVITESSPQPYRIHIKTMYIGYNLKILGFVFFPFLFFCCVSHPCGEVLYKLLIH